MEPCPECGNNSYRNPSLTVDAVALRGEGVEREVLLIRRGEEPWKGCWAFPGGFVDQGEDPEIAVIRELDEECDVAGQVRGVVAVRGLPERDPRGHVVTVFYRVDVDAGAVPVPGDDAAHAEWVPLRDVEVDNMGADHAEIILQLRREG